MNRVNRIKFILFLIQILCTIYSPYELTRIIISDGPFYFPFMVGNFSLEIWVIWFFYFVFVALAYLILFERPLLARVLNITKKDKNV